VVLDYNSRNSRNTNIPVQTTMENTELEKLRKQLNDLEEKEKLKRKIKELESKIPKEARIEVPVPQIPAFPVQTQQPIPAQQPPQPSFPSISQELEQGMKGINQGIQGIPRIIIPTPGDRPQMPMFNPQEQQKISKFKKWGLILSVAAVLTFAGYRIIMAVIR